MKKIILIICIAALLTGCSDYVQPRQEDTKATETAPEATEATVCDFESEGEEIIAEETGTPQEATEAQETETETQRETVTVYVTEGVNIRTQQTKLSDRIGGAGFGESFTAYKDTLGDDFAEIIYKGGTAYAYSRCLTTDYNFIAQMRAEQERRAQKQRVAQESTQETTQEATEATVCDFETEVEEIHETQTENATEEATEPQTQAGAIYSAEYFKLHGVLSWGGSKWTYYSQRILSGEGLNIPNRHLDENGYVCDGDGYIVCAADLSYIPRYTIIETPLGKQGKIYDTGCAYGVIDVYTDW